MAEARTNRKWHPPHEKGKIWRKSCYSINYVNKSAINSNVDEYLPIFEIY